MYCEGAERLARTFYRPSNLLLTCGLLSRGRDGTQGTLPVLTTFRSTLGYAALVRCAVPSRPKGCFKEAGQLADCLLYVAFATRYRAACPIYRAGSNRRP